MDRDTVRRIVVLGKTGSGKSSLGNTMFDETVFNVNKSANSGTAECKAESKCVNGREIIWIDTPGLFDTGRSEEEMKCEILRCITECTPGPHVFVIVLKVEKYTVHEKQVIDKLKSYFSEEAFQFATVVFTYGDEMEEGEKIEEFVRQSDGLRELVEKCGGRCHVVDNRYWKKSQDDYRNNKFQVEELLHTFDKIIEKNQGGCYTNEMLQAVEREIQEEETHIRMSSANMSPEEIKQKAKSKVLGKLLEATGITAGALLGAFLGGAMKLTEGGGGKGPPVALMLAVALGTAAGIAAGKDATRAVTAEEQDGNVSDMCEESNAEEQQKKYD